mmetsp:Transcript_9346/g.17448  ORF Transcript_9346/g.17448 Transcript_9346/m.17448 type:complete len:251 (-) Transcript_9346:126-878(-)|eukprot:CAMPEP_0182608458 /NCGR_PEP_ID=MMETSP1330-20130603/2869_1 /TAXON_ID=464278 /ORGANISM="Picochlorum sp., Strain RCC944" /LENGTH=250 /DNA_ID=CAMNT_0024827207 /DNA_START=95 /DNA_END=847 /DNA_ORIENTATION=-
MSFAKIKKKYSLTALTESLSKLTTTKFNEPISDGEDTDRDGNKMYTREVKTKAKYPKELDLTEIDASLQIPSLTFVGAGLRSETFVGVEFWIYTIGLYVEPEKVKEALKEYGECESGSMHENKDFCKALVNMNSVTRVLRFVITLSGLKAAIVVSQFDKVLLPKMKKKGKEKSYRYIMENMGKAKFRKGTVMFLALSGDGTVTCLCDGEVLGSVNCETLCQCIMEIYFGEDPISEDVKEKICNGLHSSIQ